MKPQEPQGVLIKYMSGKLMMSTKRVFILTAMMAAITVVGQVDDGRRKTADTGDAKQKTEEAELQELDITSDTMEMDFDEKKAVFEGDVKVCDEQSILTADKMLVFMTDDDELKYIEATGNVIIREVGTNKTATAGRAEFDVAKDTIVLMDNPSMSEGDKASIRQGDKIVYNRADHTFKFSGRATLTIKMPKKGSSRLGAGALLSPMGGTQKKDAEADE